MVTGTAPEPAQILPIQVYSLADVRALLGVGRDGLRTARRKGLQVRRMGRKSFVIGADLVAYLQSCPVVA